MLYHKIVNPETGRSVNINSKLGKRIIKKYINNQSGGGGNNSVKDYKKKIKYHETRINQIADGVNKEHENIHKDHVQKIEKLEMEHDNHKHVYATCMRKCITQLHFLFPVKDCRPILRPTGVL